MRWGFILIRHHFRVDTEPQRGKDTYPRAPTGLTPGEERGELKEWGEMVRAGHLAEGTCPGALKVLVWGTLSTPFYVYVRSFLYLLCTSMKLYYTKALSDPASSLAPDWILLLWRPRTPASLHDSETTFHLGGSSGILQDKTLYFSDGTDNLCEPTYADSKNAESAIWSSRQCLPVLGSLLCCILQLV